MLGKVKKWLGIEGVKMTIEIPEEIDKSEGQINGKLRFESMNPQTVSSFKVAMIEKYTRGRGKEKRIDEYEMGAMEKHDSFQVNPDQAVEVSFTLPFKVYKSEVDEMEDNFFTRGFAKVAKYFRGAKSEYRLEAEAKVKGVALNPFDKKEIKLK